MPDPSAHYDLVIRGGTVLDPAAHLRGEPDVAIAGGRIAAVEPSIPADRATVTVDARGKLVVPGIIDLHTHIFRGLRGAEPDTACLARGSTTVLDGGSVGANAFRGFKEFIIERSRPRIWAWLNISAIGLIDTRVGELLNLLYVVLDAAVQTAEANRDNVRYTPSQRSGAALALRCSRPWTRPPVAPDRSGRDGVCKSLKATRWPAA